jgi:MFS superfamily sulfate permease-like transporter
MILSLLKKIKFDKNELSGAFGDMGLSLPLILGMIFSSNLNPTNVFIIFGILLIFCGMFYGIPIPVQPLKVVGIITITRKLNSEVIYGGGLAIGVLMLIFTLTNILKLIFKIIPKNVIRGIQIGLGINLLITSLKEFIFADGFEGLILTLFLLPLNFFLILNKKYPPGLILILIGLIYSLIFKLNPKEFFTHLNLNLPSFNKLNFDILNGLIILAFPQLPLSIGNSIFATYQSSKDLFPDKKITVNKLGFTYSIMNIISSFFGGIPVCHGVSGLIGHFTFGARTGGATFIYGIFLILIGLFISNKYIILKIFPLPILGVILFIESIMLIYLSKDITKNKFDFFIATLISFLVVISNYGYLLGILIGVLLNYLIKKFYVKNE